MTLYRYDLAAVAILAPLFLLTQSWGLCLAISFVLLLGRCWVAAGEMARRMEQRRRDHGT